MILPQRSQSFRLHLHTPAKAYDSRLLVIELSTLHPLPHRRDSRHALVLFCYSLYSRGLSAVTLPPLPWKIKGVEATLKGMRECFTLERTIRACLPLWRLPCVRPVPATFTASGGSSPPLTINRPYHHPRYHIDKVTAARGLLSTLFTYVAGSQSIGKCSGKTVYPQYIFIYTFNWNFVCAIIPWNP